MYTYIKCCKIDCLREWLCEITIRALHVRVAFVARLLDNHLQKLTCYEQLNNKAHKHYLKMYQIIETIVFLVGNRSRAFRAFVALHHAKQLHRMNSAFQLDVKRIGDNSVEVGVAELQIFRIRVLIVCDQVVEIHRTDC